MTSLIVMVAAQHTQTSGSARLFNRLACLFASGFSPVRRIPDTKAETDLHLKKQTEMMTMLSSCDLVSSANKSVWWLRTSAIRVLIELT